MPTIRLNYLDLLPEQRRGGAKVVRARIRATLANPNLTKEQIQQLKDQLQKIDSWEAGTLDKAAISAPVKLSGPLASKTPAEIQKMMQEMVKKKLS
jgi:Ca2+-binding EF-hand superfamily protein